MFEFLDKAQKEDLNILLRLGPYICAEFEFGEPWHDHAASCLLTACRPLSCRLNLTTLLARCLSALPTAACTTQAQPSEAIWCHSCRGPSMVAAILHGALPHLPPLLTALPGAVPQIAPAAQR